MEKFNDIINSENLTLVDFFATWCGPCKQMHPVLEQLKQELGDRVVQWDLTTWRLSSINTHSEMESWKEQAAELKRCGSHER